VTTVALPRRLATPPQIDLFGVAFHALTEPESVDHILDALDEGRGGFVVTPNLDHLRRTVKHQDYRRLVGTADLVVADGMPIVWASHLAGAPLPGLVAGSNLITSLSRGAAERGRSVFFLGGVQGSAEGAAKVLQARFPKLRVAGTWYPPIGFEKDASHMERLIAALVEAAPDVVFVGLGSPKQEQLIARLRRELPHAWWLGVGISFSYLTGDVRRAPVWMRRCGLEWLHRLTSEPGRLARRYLVEGIPFGATLMAWSLWRRVGGRRVRFAGR
jgi:N-acetylglucosaminyldiphosphoundecaprenol N-acetyl-beta-D-mannosaminyltransferase